MTFKADDCLQFTLRYDREGSRRALHEGNMIRSSSGPNPLMNCNETSLVPIAKPIRIFQFLLIGTILALAIYTILRQSPYQLLESIFVTTISAAFFLITVVDVVSQLSGDPIPDTPMFLFGVMGILLFLLMAFGNLFVSRRSDVVDVWRVTALMVLSAVSSLLYLLDVLLIFLYGY